MVFPGEKQAAIVACLKTQIPDLLAIYAFGSRIEGTPTSESDLDMAVLVAGYADITQLWRLSGELAELAGCDVDLLDLRKASTVMQYQVITKGECWWAKDHQAALYEVSILSEKTDFDTFRAGLLKDIQESGRVYGR